MLEQQNIVGFFGYTRPTIVLARPDKRIEIGSIVGFENRQFLVKDVIEGRHDRVGLEVENVQNIENNAGMGGSI